MLIVGTNNTACGIMDGLEILRQGGSAVDAVEVTLRAVEDNASDGSVGLGGLPNLLGEVEQDASIMEGSSLRAGAVGALKCFRHPISVARQVMELLPHVFLAGEGAALFAEEIGAEKGDLVSESARREYVQRLTEAGLAEALLGPDKHMPLRQALWQNINYRPGGTSNVIAQDRDGHICCGVTTSGWAFKYPGRIGDSPIIGAGNYADDRYGAAACTGLGEITMRLCSAHATVMRMAAGKTIDEACAASIEDILRLPMAIPFGVNILVVDRRGHHALWSTHSEGEYYLFAGPDSAEPLRLPGRSLRVTAAR